MIVSGGMRPPVPITVGAGSGFPVESTETDGEAELGRRQVAGRRAAGPELLHARR